MKHIVLPIVSEQLEDSAIWGGLDPNLVRSNFFLILQTKEDDKQIVEVQGRGARTYLTGRNADWDDVFGNIQSSFLGGDYQCQVDCVVDAYGSQKAESVINELLRVFPTLGLTVSVKIVFLADVRSPYFKEEQLFYNTLKKSISDADQGEKYFRFNCAYLLMTQNEQQTELRKKILPYILQEDSLTTKPEIRTCGGQLCEMDINSLELVPKDLAVKTACAILCDKSLGNPVSFFLMATGNAANQPPKEQLDTFKTVLEKMVPVRLPASVDLLVQKGTPDGEASTKDLVSGFYRDNPDSNPSFYDHATTEELVQTPEIVNAVCEWENTIIRQACKKGDLSVYIDQLRSGSEFERLLSDYQKPMSVLSDKLLSEKDGYSETALQKLDSYVHNLGDAIRNSVFSARLRLIQVRLIAVRCRMEEIQRQRQTVVREKLAANRTKNVTGLIEKWCKDISMRLTDVAKDIPLPDETDNVSEWVEAAAQTLLDKIPTPNYEAGKNELAESGAKIIKKMQADKDEKLISIGLTSAVGVPLPEKWVAYRQMDTNETFQRTDDPVILKICEWYMELSQSTQMDENLFQRPLNKVVQLDAAQENHTGQAADDSGNTGETDYRRLEKKEKPVLNIFNGSLTFIWKDMRYTNARLEAFADTGAPNDMKKPVFSLALHYKSDDKYEIGNIDKLPSGVPVYFRIICLDKGADVPSSVQEIRMRAPRTKLEIELETVREGKFLSKKPYKRLKLKSNGSFTPQHIAVASSTGHVYTAKWEQVRDEWVSELLPSSENWQVADRPGDLIEYEIIQ